MYHVGDLVAHYKQGVCEVVAIGRIDLRVSDQEKEYYTLKPVYNKSGTLYIPVEGGDRQIRDVIAEEDAQNLIEGFDTVELLEVQEEKKRESVYRDTLLMNRCNNWMSLLKTTYTRKLQRLATGKKVINIDERYLSSAEQFLIGEFAVALKTTKEDMKRVLLDLCAGLSVAS